MKFNLNERVGLSPVDYRGPITQFNPVWESYLGPVGGSVIKTITNDHDPVKHRVEVEWDVGGHRTTYPEDQLFHLSQAQNARSRDWKNGVEDERDLVFLAFLPDHMFRIAFSFSLSPEDRRSRNNQAPFLFLNYDSAIGTYSTDHRLISGIVENSAMLQAVPVTAHYQSMARFTTQLRLPIPRALPVNLFRMPDICSVMRAVPDDHCRSVMGIFTLPQIQHTESANIYDVLYAYLDVGDVEDHIEQMTHAFDLNRAADAAGL